MTGAGILGIIIGKLRHGEEICPIILLEIDKGLGVGFYCSIVPFGLPVRLEIESNGEFLLDA